MLIGVGTTMWGWTGNAPELRCHHSWDPNEGPRVSLRLDFHISQTACSDRQAHTHQQGPAVQHRDVCSVFCDCPEGKVIQEGMETYMDNCISLLYP